MTSRSDDATPTIREALLREIEEYLSRREVQLAETTFGRLAGGDSKVVRNLRSGKDITTGKADALRRFMAENPVYPRKQDTAA